MSGKPAQAAPAEPGIPAGGLERQLNADVARLADSVQQLAQGHLDAALKSHQRFVELAPSAHYKSQIAHSQAMIKRWLG